MVRSYSRVTHWCVCGSLLWAYSTLTLRSCSTSSQNLLQGCSKRSLLWAYSALTLGLFGMLLLLTAYSRVAPRGSFSTPFLCLCSLRQHYSTLPRKLCACFSIAARILGAATQPLLTAFCYLALPIYHFSPRLRLPQSPTPALHKSWSAPHFTQRLLSP